MNLFDVTRGHEPHTGPRNNKRRNDGPRQANKAEIKAYLLWVAERRGVAVPRDAEFFPSGIVSASEGLILEMPGHGARDTVTLETLDDAGEVIASQTLPVEPKKGGVIWSREAVRAAVGPIAKPAKAKRGKRDLAPIPVAPEPVAAPIVETAPAEPVEAIQAVSGTPEGSEPIEALTGPDFAPVAVIVADPVAAMADPDPLEALAARLAALEARVAALPVEAVEAPTAVADRPRRTPAHERAIRRAWAERRAARLQRSIAEDHLRMREHVQQRVEGLERTIIELDKRMREERDRSAASYRARLDDIAALTAKRRRAVILARERGKRLEAEHRLVDRYQEKRREAEESAREWSRKEESQRRRADVAEAALAKLRADLADPTQPERASDISRLMRERDEARTALAAVDARNRALQGTVDDLAVRFEAMVSRVTRAEAALRAAGAAA